MKIPNRIQPLVDDGLVDDVISRLMSGTEADVRAMNDMVEQQLRQHPEQYMWFLKIFETMEHPQGHEGFYEEGIKRIRGDLPPEN